MATMTRSTLAWWLACLSLTAWALGQWPHGAWAQAPAVGNWASYRWTSTIKEPQQVLVRETGADGKVTLRVEKVAAPAATLFVTYAIVGEQDTAYWLQVSTHEGPGALPLAVTQILVDKKSGKSLKSVTQRPKGLIETPENELRPLRESAVKGDRQEVRVPAGSFVAIHAKVSGVEVWVSDRVAALGIAKAIFPNGVLELTASGQSGAKNLLKQMPPSPGGLVR